MKIIPFEYLNDPYYFLEFGFSRQLIEAIKYSIFKRRWSPANDETLTLDFKNAEGLPSKGWWCPVNARNTFVLARISGEKVYAKYDEILPASLISREEYAKTKGDKDLWLHQLLMKQHIDVRRACIIAAEPRTGKTRPAEEIIEEYLSNYLEQEMDVSSVTQLSAKERPWFVTRKSAMPGIWNETIKWQYPLCAKYMDVMTYTRFRNGYDGMVTPRIIFYDECHGLRDPKSVQSKTAMDITEQQIALYGDDCIRVLMSGSPVPKAPDDWYNLCEIACPGFIGPRDKQTFSLELGEWEEMKSPLGHKFLKLLGWKEEEVSKLYERLSGLVLVVMKKDCLDLPDILFEIAKCTPSEEQLEAIKYIKSQPDFNKGAALRLKLRQLADGFMYTNTTLKDDAGKILYDNDGAAKKERTTTYIECGKDQMLRDKLDEYGNARSDEPVRLVVYCGFQASVDKVVDICLEEGWTVWQIDGRGQKVHGCSYGVDIMRIEMDRSADKGLIRKLIVVAQADAAGTGMEFSSASIQIGYSNGEKADSFIQALQRPHSANMDVSRGLSWINFECLPIDTMVYDSLQNKKSVEDISLGDLQESLNVTNWYDKYADIGKAAAKGESLSEYINLPSNMGTFGSNKGLDNENR